MMAVIPVIAFGVAEETLDHVMYSDKLASGFASKCPIVLTCEASRDEDVQNGLRLRGCELSDEYGDTVTDPGPPSYVACVRFQ